MCNTYVKFITPLDTVLSDEITSNTKKLCCNYHFSNSVLKVRLNIQKLIIIFSVSIW